MGMLHDLQTVPKLLLLIPLLIGAIGGQVITAATIQYEQRVTAAGLVVNTTEQADIAGFMMLPGRGGTWELHVAVQWHPLTPHGTYTVNASILHSAVPFHFTPSTYTEVVNDGSFPDLTSDYVFVSDVAVLPDSYVIYVEIT
jgi:hypothetical protein